MSGRINGVVFVLGGEGVLCPNPNSKIWWEEGRRGSRAEEGCPGKGKRGACSSVRKFCLIFKKISLAAQWERLNRQDEAGVFK